MVLWQQKLKSRVQLNSNSDSDSDRKNYVQQPILLFLISFFCVLAMLGNLTCQKFIHVKTFSLLAGSGLVLSVGAIIYPATFLILSLITEIYGRSRAKACLLNNIIINFLVSLLLLGFTAIPATAWSKLNDAMFQLVFGFFGVAFLVSLIASFIAQQLEIWLLLLLKRLWQGRLASCRISLVAAITLAVDNILVLVPMAYLGVLPQADLWNLWRDACIWKLGVAVLMLPVAWLVLRIMRSVSIFSA